MRAMMLTAMMVTAGAAWGQDYAATLTMLKSMFVTRSELEMAYLCGFRNHAWWSGKILAHAEAARNVAALAPNLFGGLSVSVMAYADGGEFAAGVAADAEHERYGVIACERLVASGHLPMLDRLPR